MNKNKCHSVLDTESHRVLKRQKGEMLNQVQHDVFFYKGAFTLIELLVVVLIIGILAAVAVPKYQVAVLKSRLATMMPNVKSIVNFAELYYLTNGQYPDDDDLTGIDLGIEGCEFKTNRYKGTFYCPTAEYDFGYSNQDQMVAGFLRHYTSNVTVDGNYAGIAYIQYPQNALPTEKRNTQECWADSALATANKVCLSLGGAKYETLSWRGITWNKYRLP